MAEVLMVAEKPSIAKAIAVALTENPKLRPTGKGQISPVYAFNYKFLGHPARIKVTSVRGHLYNLDFPEKCKSWQRVDPAALYDSETEKRQIKDEQKSSEDGDLVKHLQTQIENCSYLVLWLDCDLEGENICYEVIDVVKGKKKSFSDENIYRARFSSLTWIDIQTAFRQENLKRPNIKQSKAVDARCEIDLKVGASFTRFQTDFFQRKYGVLRARLISFGPCQTPTLGFCVAKSDIIDKFEPETYYVLTLRLDIKPALVAQIKFKTEAKANAIKQKVEKALSEGAKVINVENISEEEPSPPGLNTVQMLQLASTRLGLSPYDTLFTAEQLYLSGLITYPRTETTEYAPSFNLHHTVELFQNHEKWGSYCKSLLENPIKQKKAFDAGDHPPITPCRSAAMLKDYRQQDLYELIVQHFLATVSPDLKYVTRTVTFRIADEEFTLKASKTTQAGFSALKSWVSAKCQDGVLSSFNVDDIVHISSLEVSAKVTTPPEHLTESELLELMKANRIGTAGSMPTHIKHVIDRNYIYLKADSRELIPTELGKMLIHGYKTFNEDLVTPVIRREIEENMKEIMTEKATYEHVLRNSLLRYKKMFNRFRQNINLIDRKFEEEFTQVSETSGMNLKRLEIRYISRIGNWKSCYNCGQDDHKAQDCPKPDIRACFNCGKTGHLSRDCTEERVKRTAKTQVCYSCGAEGHISRDCPDGRGSYRGNGRGSYRGDGRGSYRGDGRGRFRGSREVGREFDRGGRRGGRGRGGRERGGRGRTDRGNCFNCNEQGHFARDCPRKGGEAHQ